MTLEITGRVVEPRAQRPLPELWVEVWHEDRVLGRSPAPTDSEGRFGLVVDETLFGDLTGPFPLTLKIVRADSAGPQVVKEQPTQWERGQDQIQLLIEVEPAMASHEFVGQLLHAETSIPLAGLTVRGFDNDTGAEPEDLGYDISDERGMFALAYRAPVVANNGASTRTLHLSILDSEGEQISSAMVEAEINQIYVAQIPVDLPALPQPSSPSLAEVAEAIGLEVPPELLQHLAEAEIPEAGIYGIHTLADIRRAGGIAQLPALPLSPEDTAVRMLDAHADLDRLSSPLQIEQETSLQVNAALISGGYTSVASVADAPRTDIVGVGSELLGDVKAAQMHVVAQAQTNVLQNEIATIQTSWANGQAPADSGATLAPATRAVAPSCGCPDCQAAVSPLAYLADLLHYSLKHLKQTRPVEGLKGYYYDSMDLTDLKLIRVDPKIDFTWKEKEAPDSLDHETFSVRWTGYITPRYSETYTFYTTSDDGVRLWVDSRLIIDNWTDHSPKTDSGAITLVANRKYELCLEFYEHGVSSMIKLEWSSSSQPQEVIPSGQFSSTKDEPIDLPFLHATFHQRFGDLPTSCQALEQEVRQVRLCIEVLRSYMRAQNLPSLPLKRDALARDEAAYRYAAYQTLLVRIGTTYDDLWRAHAADSQVQTTLAERLGIAPAHLATLFLPQPTTEAKLQELFGLADTTRADVLDHIGTPLLEQWRLERLRARWEQEDWPSDPYDARLPGDKQLPWIDPDLIGPDDFRHPVAKGSPLLPDGPFDLWLERRVWVDARLGVLVALVEPDGSPNWTALLVSMQQNVQAWGSVSWKSLKTLRDAFAQGKVKKAEQDELYNVGLTVESLNRLMALREQDRQNSVRAPAEVREIAAILVQVEKVLRFPAWLAEEETLPLGLAAAWIAQQEPREGEWPPARLISRPLIDPELSGVDEPLDGIDRKAAQRLWQLRRARLDQIRSALQAAHQRKPGQTEPPNITFDQMLSLALGHPNSGDPLPVDLDKLLAELDDSARAEQARQTVAQQLFLTVDGFRRLMEVKAKPTSTSAVWSEVYNLLTSAQKLKREYPAWLVEEAQLPLIDPEALNLTDLPDAVAGQRAIKLWNDRKKVLEDEYRHLKEKQEDNGFDAMLREALRDPATGAPLAQSPELTRLSTELKGDEQTARDATIEVTNKLFMTIEDFERLMVIKAKADQATGSKQPTGAEWAEVYLILRSAQKQKGRYTTWRMQEQNPAGTLVYSGLLKSRLPRWRASAVARQTWQQAVRARFGAPIVDPDLIGLESIDRSQVKVNQLWRDRWQELANALDTLVSDRGDVLDKRKWLSEAVLRATGVGSQHLRALEVEREKGADISARLEQLFLSRDAFAYLVRIDRVLEAGQPVFDWVDIDNILVQIHKRKQFFWWRVEEQQLKLVLSPDFFKLPPVDTSIFPPPQPGQPLAWRVAPADLQAWQDKLQARIEQRQAVIEGLRAAVSATEEITLPALRDALLRAIGPLDNTQEDNARWFTDRFLIDAKADGCQKTTRVAQAIETLQGILWSIRTRQLNDTYPDLELDADDFDEEWQWLGSYGTWRAAMFVFLYPENILLPTLRRWKTPGFLELMGKVRADSALTPESACEAARGYFSYLRDVCSLQLEASCEANTRLPADETCRDGASLHYDSLVFLFARSAVTNKAYWSTIYSAGDRKCPEQTVWTAVPKLPNLIRMLGAVPYRTRLGQRYIFLFTQVLKEGNQKLVFVKYDLEAPGWVEEDPKELSLPPNGSSFTAVVAQQVGMMRQPQLIIRATDGTIYENHLNLNGTDLALNPWEKIIEPGEGQYLEPLDAVAQDFPQYYLFVRRKNAEHSLLFRRFHMDTELRWYKLGAAQQWDWIGATTTKQLGAIFAFWLKRNDNGSTDKAFYQEISQSAQGGYIRYSHINQLAEWLKQATDGRFNLWGVLKGDLYGAILKVHEAQTPADKQRAAEAANNMITYFEQNLSTIEGGWDVANNLVKKNSYSGMLLPGALRGLVAGTGVEMRRLVDPFTTTEAPSLSNLQRIAPSSGESVSGNNERLIALQRSGLQQGLWLSMFAPSLQSPFATKGHSVAPRIVGPFGLPHRLSETELQARRLELKAIFEMNTAGTDTNTVYQQEAFYFVPVHIALQLQQRGYYVEALNWLRAVYDYSMPRTPRDQRKIYYGLTVEESASEVYKRVDDWLQDPLNPHAIAATRRNTYTRFTLLSLVRCLLDYADAEFTRDTAESLPRARTLYLTALEVLNQSELKQQLNLCESLIGQLEIQVDDPSLKTEWEQVKKELAEIDDYAALLDTVERTKQILVGGGDWNELFASINTAVQEAKDRPPRPDTQEGILTWQEEQTAQAHMTLQAQPDVAEAVRQAGVAAAEVFLSDVSAVSGTSVTVLAQEPVKMPWLRERKSAAELPNSAGTSRRVPGIWFSQRKDRPGSSSSHTGRTPGAQLIGTLRALKGRRKEKPAYVPSRTYGFCVPPNPVVRALRLRAELNLYKLRTCRNIAGLRRQVEAYAAPADTTSGLPAIGAGGQLILPGTARLAPTPYRYAVLIERAKQLAGLAQQMEGAFLNALEKLDAERYNLLKARQDMSLAQAGVDLQKLRVTEAKGGVSLAQLQQQRVTIQRDHYQGLLQQGFSDYEKRSLGLLTWAARFQYGAALFSGLSGALAVLAAVKGGGAAGGAAGGPPGAAAGAGVGAALIGALPGISSSIASGLSSWAQGLSTDASILSALGSYERRTQEWSFQYDLANQDIFIGDTQIQIANDHVRVVHQEQTIAEMQTGHAREMVDFLTTKFTNAELYNWMSGVLERVFSFFLQQATSTARLAANQLAFERYEVPPTLIQADYWETPTKDNTTSSADGKTPDRRGLTGSARLLQDIYQLDQYAFGSTRRKHQLSKMISLMRLAPYEFQRFRETGVITFTTPMDLFDRDFPGHYLRLIKRVRVSVIALIPPTEGIRATLRNSGISRVVVGPDVFQTIVVRRDPEAITLSSPMNATGLFELEQQPELSLPFEHIGVDTTWELRMPRASNPFDYRSIADIFMTIEYTALDNFDYRQQVIQRLDRTISAERPFSFRHELPDQWYDLHNPEFLEEEQQMVVSFRTAREDFPPNVDGLTIQHIVLYFARKGGINVEIPVVSLRFAVQGNIEPVGGEASPVDGVISTRGATAASWEDTIPGKPPIGTWTLALPNTEDMRKYFKQGQIEDILFVITYTGRTPEWPL